MGNKQQKLKNAIRVITIAAKDYSKTLDGHNYIFIYKNRNTNQIEYFESIFLARNFQHLTGIEFIDNQGNLLQNPTQFYQKCVSSTLNYVPSSCLLEDIRNLADVTYQILAIFSKPATKTAPIYKNVRYVAKGIKLNHLTFPDDLSALISLENYTEK